MFDPELIIAFQNRVYCSSEEAEQYLSKTNGDLEAAVALFEKDLAKEDLSKEAVQLDSAFDVKENDSAFVAWSKNYAKKNIKLSNFRGSAIAMNVLGVIMTIALIAIIVFCGIEFGFETFFNDLWYLIPLMAIFIISCFAFAALYNSQYKRAKQIMEMTGVDEKNAIIALTLAKRNVDEAVRMINEIKKAHEEENA